MSVIVLILKIIGIVLLVLLALILLVLLLVLIVPVRYRISGTVEEQAALQVKVTWLLHLVSWSATYADGSFTPVLRIFGIRQKEKQDDGTDEEGYAEDTSVGQVITLRKTESTEDISVKQVDAVRDDILSVPQESITDAEHAKDVWRDEESQSKEKRTLSFWTSGIRDRIRAYFTGLRRKLFRIKETLLQMFIRMSSIRELLTDELNHLAFAGIFQEICYLLRHFRFRRVNADIGFSLGDPAATGQAFGAVSVLPFIYRYRCHVVPDFEAENTYVRGSVQILGWARGVHVVMSLIRLWRKKEVRRLYRQLSHR